MSKFPEAAAVALAGLLLAGTPPVLAQGQASPEKSGLGRAAHADEVKAWDLDVRADGHGVPPGKGSVKGGERLFLEQCASCHGEFGEGAGRWPVLAGGRGTLQDEHPEKTIGSFWPYATTTFDYIRRSMPYGNAQSLSDDDVYALTAFLLHMSEVVDAEFVLSSDNIAKVALPNREGFYDDDRETSERHFWVKEPCMKNCKTEAKVLNRARVLDVTPDDKGRGSKVD